ncbi:MAG: hypothetical protein JNJ78_21990 [Anaerolineae bacterium]|nr:hypothetical protein [Anaerolineae bacterium]
MKRLPFLLVAIFALWLTTGVALAQSGATITSFTTSYTSIEQSALNSRTVLVPVSWTTANRPNTANLVFEQALPDGRVMNIELPRQNPFVASNGSGVVQPFPPGEGATQVVLRLRLVNNANGTTIDQEDITIPIGAVTGATPTITAFATTATSVAQPDLDLKTARISVTFAVENRPANTNLVFEQVQPDNTAVNVELPRQNPIVPSSGNGVVAPVASTDPNATSITLRLRLINLNDNSTITQKDITLPIASAPVVTPVITTFSTTATNVNRDALTARTARIPVAFAVDNRPANTNLVFEQVLEDNTAVNIELPRQIPIIPSSGNGVVAPVAPQQASTTAISIRLRVIDLNTQNTLIQQTFVLPIAEPAAPTIRTFSTTASNVNLDALIAGTARLPVSFAVDNRPVNSNLVFEQLLEDNTAVNVELPRQNPIVPSSGTGVVAPVAPQNTNTGSIRLRLRLIDLANQNTIVQQTFMVAVVTPGSGTPVIDAFSTTAQGVTRAALQSRAARLPVTWTVSSRPANSNLVFEQVLDDNSVLNVELPRQNPIIPSSGTGTVAPVAPTSSAVNTITIRLRVIDLTTQNTLVERVITIPIIESADSPVIRSFTTTAANVADSGLTNRTARIPVSWEVVNRPANSNLVFEQVLDNNTVVNVELPRQNPIVSSGGNGTVAPVAPTLPTTATIRLRLRLVNLTNNTTIVQSELTLPITGRTAVTPEPTPDQASPIAITSFTITPNPAERAGGITLTWTTSGAVDRVKIDLLTEYGASTVETILDEQPASGTAPYTLPSDYINSATFQLSAFNASGQETILTAAVNINCPFTTPMSEGGMCPVTQATEVPTAFQPFEKGLLFWRGDTNKIYVLYTDDSTWQEFDDTWNGELLPDSVGSAPAGLIKPERGFGKVWYEIGGSGVLGWATAAESSYEATWETYQVVDAGQVAIAPTFTLEDGRVVSLGLVWSIN